MPSPSAWLGFAVATDCAFRGFDVRPGSLPFGHGRSERGSWPMGQRRCHEERQSMTNDELRLDVAAELSWDPKVDSRQIAVSADGGAVTLRGTVGSLREKR